MNEGNITPTGVQLKIDLVINGTADKIKFRKIRRWNEKSLNITISTRAEQSNTCESPGICRNYGYRIQ